MNRVTIIQSLIDKHNYKSYLEIGVRDGSCFNTITCETKIGVDPDQSSAATVFQTSDEFFKNLNIKFDIIFIDGLHHADQVEKDIQNSLDALNPGGIIVMHDCLPTSEFMQRIPMLPEHNEWTGDTWRAYFKFRRERADLEMSVVDTDWGCGLIRPGTQTLLSTTNNPFYEDFARHKYDWMNVISVEEFKQRYL